MSTIQTNAIVDASGGNTATVNGKNITSSNTMGRNIIINGGFDVWQRGTNFSSASYTYTSDRWKVNSATVAKTANGYKNAISLTSTAVFASLIQVVENGWKLKGKEVTYSFDVTSPADMGTAYLYYLNTSGSGIANTTVNFSTAGRKSVTFTIPSDGSSTSNFEIRIVINGNGSERGSCVISDVQLELGSLATDFDQRTYAAELTACQRYYQQMVCGSDAFTFPGKGQGSTSVDGTFPLAVPLRASPTMNAITTRFFSDDGFTTSTAAPTTNQFSADNCHLAVNIASFSGGTAFSNNHAGVWCPQASTLKIDAEL